MAAREEVEEIHYCGCRLGDHGFDDVFNRCDQDIDAEDMGSVRHLGDFKGEV